MTAPIQNFHQKSINLWQPLQKWLEGLEIQEAQTARRIVKLIPSQCPFARDVRVFGRVIFRIPALCKLNPLYEQLMGLRFRALCFLADTCGEDITPYCW
ncbi:Mo-dependent nitrogenase C-terminal domain-containing protein [Myxosarcina sp. GI1]|uniref:Mo-dependent nitrogenase C-terminal domain-containing protein n=1 Tax=Myxosarcina sp. GI1 TaxID=1541065 RepID=UPI00056379E9|nr:Mo-dependent nitrogenase C-terminal domain-containing protein [Myxosarcina sp. GI1]